jgi:FixJ family two-component response regulator
VAVPGQVHVLLIEDDDGDALLVQELLLEASAPVALNRVRSITEAKPLLASAACVLLDLDLPDAHQLQGVHWLQENVPQVAVVVLTGLADEHLGAEAVGAGAQDYLVKGQVDGSLLSRVIHYAVERRRFEEMQQQLREAQIYARENARLERGLLPLPLLADARLTVATRYRPGGGQMLLGGDFFDLVEGADGWVHVVVGDVCGRGPEEAALGVCLRWPGGPWCWYPWPRCCPRSSGTRARTARGPAVRHVVRGVSRAGPDAREAAPGRAPAAAAAGPGRGDRAEGPAQRAPGIAHVEDWPVTEVALGMAGPCSCTPTG